MPDICFLIFAYVSHLRQNFGTKFYTNCGTLSIGKTSGMKRVKQVWLPINLYFSSGQILQKLIQHEIPAMVN